MKKNQRVIENAHEAYDINWHSIYYRPNVNENAFTNIYCIANTLFQSTYIYQNRELLKKLDATKRRGGNVPAKQLEGFRLNGLLDNIKISTCFENILKAMLITNEYVVHKLAKGTYPNLFEEQKRRPIHISEIESSIKKGIQSSHEELKIKYKGLLKETIHYSWMLKGTGYCQFFEKMQPIYPLLIETNDKRNELHFLLKEQFMFTSETYVNFKKLYEWFYRNYEYAKKQFPALNEDPQYIIKDFITGEESIEPM